MVDHAALAGGVHALQHDEHRPGAPAGGLGVQRVLQVGEPVAQLDELLGGAVLVARADRAVARADRGRPLRRDAERFAR